MNSVPSMSYRIGDFIYHPQFRELVRDELTVRLEERAAQALDLLCQEKDRVVSRAELIEEIWQGRAVSDNSVAVVISDLRKALNDDARAPKIIQTVHKRGYRALNVTVQDQTEIPQPIGNTAFPIVPRNNGFGYLALAACISCSVAAIVYFIT